MKGTGRLIILSGPSGVGKTTVGGRLVSLPGIERVVTATTRAPRPGERDGVDYHFLNREEFERGIREGRFLEHARVHGNLYGTPLEAIRTGLTAGRRLLLTIDVTGARQVREHAGDLPLVSIFLLPPDAETLSRRLGVRGSETAEEVRQRLERAGKELEEREFYDYQVTNDDLEEAVEEIRKILGSLE